MQNPQRTDTDSCVRNSTIIFGLAGQVVVEPVTFDLIFDYLPDFRGNNAHIAGNMVFGR